MSARSADEPGLDFAVIGAAKAGTTALFHLIRTHPELYLPEGKELPYFVSPRHSYYESPAQFYAGAFGGRRSGQLCGTVTPQYLYGALLGPDDERVTAPRGESERLVPERIRDVYPEARLIAILRDPVARAHSHHRMSRMRGFEGRPFDTAVAELLEPDALAASRERPTEINGYVVLGEYARLLQGYLDVFPREQLLVLRHDRLASDPGAVCGEVFAFLGVDPDFAPPNLGRRYHEGANRRRFGWLDLTSWQQEARRSSALTDLWQRLPRGFRRRALERYNLASRRLQLWNKAPADAEPEPDPPSEETLARLRAHYRNEERRLQALLGAAAPSAGAKRES